MADSTTEAFISVPESHSTSKSTYSSPVAFAYIFNLIVGVGVLALPQAFNKSGILLGSILLLVLCAASFISACYVIESMAAANAFHKMQKRRSKVKDLVQRSRTSSLTKYQMSIEKSDETKSEESMEGSTEKISPLPIPINNSGIPSYCIDVSSVHNPDRKEEDVNITEVTPLLQSSSDSDILHLAPTDSDFEIHEKYELGTMANMFYPTIGVILYYICVIVYLFGDLSIYAVTAPTSLTVVICNLFAYYNNLSQSGHYDNDSEKTLWNETIHSPMCFNEHLQKFEVYYIFLALFILSIGPFTFFNMTKTKLMQITTTILRYLAFAFLISLAFLRIAQGNHNVHSKLANIAEFPGLFGVSIYAFMCQHSLPGIVTPMNSKRWIYSILLSDFVLILFFYMLLSYSGSFAFLPGDMEQLYSLDFFNASDPVWKLVFGTYLALFPVFTLTTTFPIISVTLRENLKSLVKTIFLKWKGEDITFPFLVDRILFPLLVLTPPVIIAYSTRQIDILVSITGSFPGVGVQYVIPATLVLMVQYKMRKEFGKYRNPYRTPLSHFVVLGFIFLWSVVSVGLIIVDMAINPPKIQDPFTQ